MICSRIRAGLQLVRVGLVGRRRGGRERQRVEDRRLGVVRIGRGDAGHRVTVRHDARALIDASRSRRTAAPRPRCTPARVRSSAPIAFARFTASRPGCKPLPVTDGHRERIAPSRQRDAPRRHRARRVGRQRRVELLDGMRELERVKQRDRPVEHGLGRGAAGGLKADGAELLAGRRGVFVVLRQQRGWQPGARAPRHMPA